MAEPINEIQGRYIAQFEQLGEAALRQQIMLGHLGETKKLGYAKAWLAGLEAKRQAAVEAAQGALTAKSIDAAERSAKAAEDAASTAREANRLAETANGTAKLAMLIAALGAFIVIMTLVLGRWSPLPTRASHGKAPNMDRMTDQRSSRPPLGDLPGVH